MKRWLIFGAAVACLAGPKSKEGYIMSETCTACHEDIGKSFAKSRHAIIDTDENRGWKGMACESCHGPGAKHGEAAEAKFILNPAKAATRQADAACLSCHRNQTTSAGRVKGSHGVGQASCVSCHSVHHESRAHRETANALCTSCHLEAKAQFARPHTHRVAQNAMTCLDCHNPHGTIRQAGLASTARAQNNEPGCLKCHTDKRGPFAFEHAPVRLEGCNACHEPHGSANPRMLNRADVMNQCLECHASLPNPANKTGTLGSLPPSFHDLRSPFYRNCTTCHVKIHGSHVSRSFLR